MIKTVLRRGTTRIRQAALDTMCRQLMAAPANGRAPFDFNELKMVRAALISQNLCCVDGQMVREFERQFAFSYGVPYAVASTSGTAAIHVALGALDLNPGDEVITAPITDMGTIIPMLSLGAIPVFADVDRCLNMDPASVEQCITPRTKAIVAVHLFGNPCDMDALTAIASRYNLPLIEDCAQAHRTEYRGRLVGTIGDIGCFSFQQSKHMTTGDGGMTITSNAAYHERMKLFADKGYARKGWGSRAYLFHAPNYRMTELVGAVGLAQLQKVQDVVAKRRELGERLTQLLSGIEGVEPAPVTSGAQHSYWLYPVRVSGDAEAVAAEMIKRKLWVSAGYTGKPIYLCSESLTAKKTFGSSEWPFTCNPGTTYDYVEGLCPKAEEALKHLVCIPLDESRDRDYVEHIATIVANAMDAVAGRSESRPAPTPRPVETPIKPASPHTSKPRLRIGIVGCGQMGRWHLNAYAAQRNVELVGFADTSLERAQRFAHEVGGRAYASHQELLANEALDGLSICTVPSTHCDVAIDALDAGIHVLCEKPLAISVNQAEAMSARAKQKNRLLFTAFKFRFHDEVRMVKHLIDSGRLGRVLSFRLMFGGYIDMQGQWYAHKMLSGGGIIMDNGPHAADLIRFLFGDITSIAAQSTSVQKLEVEDTAKLDMVVEGGAVGTGDLSWSLKIPARSYLEIYGEDGAAALDGEGVSYKLKTWSSWKREDNRRDAQGAFSRQIAYFVDAIHGDNPLALGNGEGVASQRVIEAAYQSVQQKRRIEIHAAKG
jgi:dTDP-4-amino-4,6-dideoxygalactose transaminase/predicted dehydrogenase